MKGASNDIANLIKTCEYVNRVGREYLVILLEVDSLGGVVVLKLFCEEENQILLSTIARPQ